MLGLSFSAMFRIMRPARFRGSRLPSIRTNLSGFLRRSGDMGMMYPVSSHFYYKEAVARARGTVDMYYRLNDPEYRGDVVGFNMRGVATPVTGKYLGAVYSPKA